MINTSRGGVVDQAALTRALTEGRIAGAGLDVLETEPPDAGDPLLAMPNVVVLPHLGSATTETRAAMLDCAVDNLATCLRGEDARTCCCTDHRSDTASSPRADRSWEGCPSVLNSEVDMRTFLRLAVVIVCVAAGAAIGMTASAWASGGGAPKGPFPPARLRHAIDPSVLSERPPVHVDSTFVPIAPCRIVDTLLAGGALGNGVTRTFYVGGTTNFTAQGGKPGGCGIPINATLDRGDGDRAHSSRTRVSARLPANQASPTPRC